MIDDQLLKCSNSKDHTSWACRFNFACMLFLFLSASLFSAVIPLPSPSSPSPSPSPLSLSPLSLSSSLPDPLFYRALISKVRNRANFLADIPIEGGLTVSYRSTLGAPILERPQISDFFLSPESANFYRIFIDRISFQDGSLLKVGKVELPLTCMFVYGQDNRFSGKVSPLVPDFVFKFYFVANDFSCTGPLNPAWPTNVSRRENWDSFLYFEVRDPTIMLPVEAKIRYRWNEFAIFKKEDF